MYYNLTENAKYFKDLGINNVLDFKEAFERLFSFGIVSEEYENMMKGDFTYKESTRTWADGVYLDLELTINWYDKIIWNKDGIIGKGEHGNQLFKISNTKVEYALVDEIKVY